MPSNDTITSLAQAIDFFGEMLRENPERDALAAHEGALEGRRREFPTFWLAHLVDPEDKDEPVDDYVLPDVVVDGSDEMKLAGEIVRMLEPLKMLNPIQPCFSLGVGPGTLVASFGLELNPEGDYQPYEHKTIREFLDDPVPDPPASGMLPEFKERIDLIKAHVPDDFKISLPDTQGPFNLAHQMFGNEVFTAPYVDPDAFRAAMERITDTWLGIRQTVVDWIGAERLLPAQPNLNRICECSVNMVSPEFYTEHILPHDLRIVEALGQVSIHPCSGPHVFHVTLQNVPNVVFIEAGTIAQTAAGSISVADALEAIGDRPITLLIGQEPPRGQEYDFIRRDLDRYRTHPRLLFSYTGMHWRKKDRPMIRDLHRKLDAYWEQEALGSRLEA